MPRAAPLPEAPQTKGGTSGLLCLGVGLPVLGNEEGLERLCRTDRMGFGDCVEKLRDLCCWTL